MSTMTIVIAVVMVLVAIGGIIYMKKNPGKSSGKSAPGAGTGFDWKKNSDPVTPSMGNPTGDPAKEQPSGGLADVVKVGAKKPTKKK